MPFLRLLKSRGQSILSWADLPVYHSVYNCAILEKAQVAHGEKKVFFMDKDIKKDEH
jgi:hypothetical protein